MAGFTHPAGLLGVGEHQLVHDDVVRVDAALGQLLDEPLRLVEGEELGDAHADEGGLLLMKPKRQPSEPQRTSQRTPLSGSREMKTIQLPCWSQTTVIGQSFYGN